ncbi:hypothetical protein DYB25_004663, partial [Aphanomyces astaci]
AVLLTGYTCAHAVDETSAVDDALRWGTYHSGHYFGIRSRTSPFHVSAGLLWSTSQEPKLRHECLESDRLEQYGWLEHDGRTFGSQAIRDQHNNLLLDTTFLKPPTSPTTFATRSWAARVAVTPLRADAALPDTASLFFYLDLGCEDDSLTHACRRDTQQVQLTFSPSIVNDLTLHLLYDEAPDEVLPTTPVVVMDGMLPSFHSAFQAKFQAAFPHISPEFEPLGQAALSNLIGGIGYFYGRYACWSSLAEARVPAEFITQFPTHANPPSLLLAVEKLLPHLSQSAVLHRWWPQLRKWFAWYQRTQAGEEPHTFRAILAKVALAVGDTVEARTFSELSQTYLDTMNRLHWDPATSLYYDYGLHSDDGLFEDHLERLQFVRRVGYVSFFPLFLQILPLNSPKLAPLGTLVANELLSLHGLMSLSPRDLYFERPNAPGDAPYWRGPIWMNINYLALVSFQHYATHASDKSVREQYQSLYDTLRDRVVAAISHEYKATGYLYEQYNPHTGRGQRCHPFSGWTALVVNILAETY